MQELLRQELYLLPQLHVLRLDLHLRRVPRLLHALDATAQPMPSLRHPRPQVAQAVGFLLFCSLSLGQACSMSPAPDRGCADSCERKEG